MRRNRHLSLALLVVSTVLLSMQSALHAEPVPPTVYVSGDGSGDYNCDGTSDQVQINRALDFVADNSQFTTVYLKGPMTYWIDEPIVISSHTIWTGDSTAKVQLIDHARWPVNKPLVRQKGVEHWKGTLAEAIYGTHADAISDVEIGGFEISGGNQSELPGSWYYILLLFYSTSDLKIHDMHLHDSCSDIIRIMSTGEDGRNRNTKIYNNRFEKSGHEGMYLVYFTDLEIYGNEIYGTRTNAGIRIEQSSHISVHDNTIGNRMTSVPSGYAGILIKTKGILGFAEIYGNYIFGKAGGIVLVAEASSKLTVRDAHIHHNVLYKICDNTAGGDHYLNGGIHLFGAHRTLIEFNTIEGSYQDGIIFEIGGEKKGPIAGRVPGYETIVRNNNIGNCGRYGINNRSSDYHTFVCDYNNVYDNARGDYNNASSATDIHAEPLYVAPTGTDPDAVDLHLQSECGRWNGSGWVRDSETSPSIDQGDPAADYSAEPPPNGGRVNIGMYGGTVYASKGLSLTEEPTTAVLEERGAGQANILELESNLPNPFNGETVIRFALPAAATVELALYNLVGQQVALLAAGAREAGVHSVRWDGRDDSGRLLASGVYIYQLRAGGSVERRKLLLLW